jgi:hypothetical protein
MTGKISRRYAVVIIAKRLHERTEDLEMRPALPYETAKIRGLTKKNPQRYKEVKRPEKTQPLGDPPEDWAEAYKKTWEEIKASSIEGILSEADRVAFESLCCIVVEMREDFRAVPTAKLVFMMNTLGRFGMTPADRIRMQSQRGADRDKKKPESEFDTFQ